LVIKSFGKKNAFGIVTSALRRKDAARARAALLDTARAALNPSLFGSPAAHRKRLAARYWDMAF
jgi:hypothetical protein